MTATILIAEDHVPSLELMRYLLKASGYRTLIAEDGATAVKMAQTEHPDLIVCDLQMPGLNGYEVLNALRADPALKSVRMIAVTAFSMLGDRERVLTAGFDGYFSKPIEAETFVEQMEPFLPVELRAQRGQRL